MSTASGRRRRRAATTRTSSRAAPSRAEALKEGVEGITGLPIDRFVMLNIDGLRDLIDAMGGCGST
ncbi:hypothetical protein G7085_12605 [Tessaracoccus sp. HDW20]|uniref:LCP family glycopolymer transferase n=1 Tax=Tessaracoccus coleopterorum TaxID=2714950 RepID=UPI0018D31A61|nr:LCP family protein [Tessaracoccus coleopterorum]NHB85179.1 hypothetical protein [Tessaracoccus coleopterorum]